MSAYVLYVLIDATGENGFKDKQDVGMVTMKFNLALMPIPPLTPVKVEIN
jgi:hypothetical protein